jgi:hypothetical protein
LFEANSQLRDIAPGVFLGCSSLQAICVPSSITRLSLDNFESCAISVLTFESPSHLESLWLRIPGDFAGERLQIPDSVTSVFFELSHVPGPTIVVQLGLDSRLSHFRCRRTQISSLVRGSRGVFLHASTKTLRYFRDVIDG